MLRNLWRHSSWVTPRDVQCIFILLELKEYYTEKCTSYSMMENELCCLSKVYYNYKSTLKLYYDKSVQMIEQLTTNCFVYEKCTRIIHVCSISHNSSLGLHDNERYISESTMYYTLFCKKFVWGNGSPGWHKGRESLHLQY